MTDSVGFAAVLSDEHLLHPELPARWRTLRQMLAELDALVRAHDKVGDKAGDKAGDKVGDNDRETLRDQAAALRERMLAEVGAIAAADPDPLPISSERHMDWFADAVLLWTWFARAGGRVLVDTVGIHSLAEYPLDFDPDAEAGADEILRTALAQVTGLSPEALQARERRLGRLTANLSIKHALTGAISARIAQAAHADAVVLDLFLRMYGDVPLRPGDVQFVCTSALMFFCIPMAEATGELARSDFHQRPAEEQRRINGFLADAQRASLSAKKVRFPAFGLFDRNKLDDRLLGELRTEVAAQAGLESVSVDVLAQTLETMVMIVPSDKAEMFLVHDVWGHSWQETLCEFEWLFADFRHLDQPLTPDLGASTRHGDSGVTDGAHAEDGKSARSAHTGEITLRNAFTVRDGHVALDRDILEQVVEADLRHRVKVGLNLATSECLADLIEHKFARLFGSSGSLPSSSLLPQAVLKLDLSLVDLGRAAKLWSKPYRRLIDDAKTRARLAKALDNAHTVAEPEHGSTHLPGFDDAVAQAAEHIAERFAHVFSTEAGLVQASESVVEPTTVLERAFFAVLTLDGDLSRVIDEGFARYQAMVAAAAPGTKPPRWHCPAACIDLLALLLGWYYERDHAVVVWHLDELLRDEILPALIALEGAISAAIAARAGE